MKKNVLLVSLLVFFAFCFSPMPASAQELGLSILPHRSELHAQPGETKQIPLTITNTSDVPVELRVRFQWFTASEKENGEVVFLSDEEVRNVLDPDLFSKITVTENDQPVETITVGPKISKPIKIILLLAPDQTAGDYYFSAIFTSRNTQTSDTPHTRLQLGIVSHVLLTVGPKEAKGTIVEFSSPVFVERGPIPFTVRVRNTGKTVLTPKGSIIIKNVFSQSIGRVVFAQTPILSQTTRSLIDSMQDAPVDKEQAVKLFGQPHAVWPESFLLGPYQATLTLSLSDKGPVYTQTRTFFAFPTQFLILVGLLFLCIILLRKRIKKYRK